ncbi:MAG: hypothetical protein KGV44_14190 [Flavobacteriaceae bacterium]|nr:hypothetical protein [Flavobacteriaceae bacterium]
MEEFRFYQDQKCEQWERLYFTVKAENFEKAKEQLNGLYDDEICTDESKGICTANLEIIEGAVCLCSLGANEGKATLEIYDEQGNLLGSNLNAEPNGSYAVTSLSVEDLQELGFDTTSVTNADIAEIARKMDLSDAFWTELEYRAKMYGLEKK